MPRRTRFGAAQWPAIRGKPGGGNPASRGAGPAAPARRRLLTRGETTMAAPEIADLDPDERDIVSVVHDWVEASVRPVARDLEHGNTYPGELIDAMKQLGVFGLAVPQTYGRPR